jgi:hypothetical protein
MGWACKNKPCTIIMFQKGQSGNPNGRPKGASDMDTRKIRVAFHNLLENNLDNISLWLAQVAAKDPQKAVDLTLKLSEFIIPKLARQEIVGQDGQDLKVSFNFSTASDEQDKEGTQSESGQEESKDSE